VTLETIQCWQHGGNPAVPVIPGFAALVALILWQNEPFVLVFVDIP
jgi:hypothetical protein